MPIVLAGNESASFTPPELFAGEADIVTNSYTFASGQALPQYRVVAFDAAGELVAWVADAVDTTAVAVGITCFAVDASGGAVAAPVYVGGYFNTDSLIFGTATDQQIQDAFINTNITHRSLSGA